MVTRSHRKRATRSTSTDDDRASSLALQPSEDTRLRWLLDFLQRDLAGLRPGEQLDLRTDLFAFVDLSAMAGTSLDEADTTALLEGAADGQARGAALKLMGRLQAEILAGLKAAETNGRWTLFTQDPAPQWVIDRQVDGTLVRRYSGSFRATFLGSAADLLVRWWSQLRRCKRTECRVLFLPRHGRQRYHDARCSWLARWGKFAPTRERDYHQEYAKRIAPRVGVRVKPQRRAARRKEKNR